MLGTPRGDVGRIEAFGDKGGLISPAARVHELDGVAYGSGRLGHGGPSKGSGQMPPGHSRPF